MIRSLNVEYGGERDLDGIPHETSPTGPCVTVSLGVVTARPDRGSTPEELVTLADRQLYLAKSGGRNRIQGMDRQPG